MKFYRKLIKPMIGFPGQNGEPKRAPIESEEKWYPEEDREKLIAKYQNKESNFERLIFEEKYEEVKILKAEITLNKAREMTIEEWQQWKIIQNEILYVNYGKMILHQYGC